jgi:hypothetical protein
VGDSCHLIIGHRRAGSLRKKHKIFTRSFRCVEVRRIWRHHLRLNQDVARQMRRTCVVDLRRMMIRTETALHDRATDHNDMAMRLHDARARNDQEMRLHDRVRASNDRVAAPHDVMERRHPVIGRCPRVIGRRRRSWDALTASLDTSRRHGTASPGHREPSPCHGAHPARHGAP